MCGIAGIFDLRGRRPVDHALIRRMTDALTHRGPDGEGFHVEPGLALGHRRLSIIDVAGGAQPIFNETGDVCITYNGELYNYLDLTRELVAAGHRFTTVSDTEAIVHGYEEWGAAALDRMVGMFAFAVWDGRSETLFLARDRVGEKPLHYAVLPSGWLVFGSEIKALLAHPEVARAIDPQAVEDFFAYGYVPEPRTIYAGLYKLPAGHYLSVRRGAPAVAPRRYWDVRFDTGPARALADSADGLIGALRRSVAGQLMSEVPLGAFLSGGIDSSAVVAMMAGAATGGIDAFTIGYDDPRFDESRFAAAAARRYGARHRIERVDPADITLVDALPAIYDEPFGDSSALPTLALCRLTRRHVTVALSGDGGDELFAGYRRYPWHVRQAALRRRIPERAARPLFRWLGRHYPRLDRLPRFVRARHMLQELGEDEAGGYFLSVSAVGDDVRRRLLSPELRRRLDGYHARQHVERGFAAAGTDDPLGQALYTDFTMWLPGDILTKVDRAAMSTSLEVRVPLLDHRLVEWAAALPSSFRIRAGERKYILKRALEPYVARELLYRTKQGFSMPIADWFRGAWAARLRADLTAGRLAATGLFDMTFVGALLERHQSGRQDHGTALWLLWMFDRFLAQPSAVAPVAAEPARARGDRVTS
jgi:asparagine synthase (glutamine-hydrolysing)